MLGSFGLPGLPFFVLHVAGHVTLGRSLHLSCYLTCSVVLVRVQLEKQNQQELYIKRFLTRIWFTRLWGLAGQG